MGRHFPRTLRKHKLCFKILIYPTELILVFDCLASWLTVLRFVSPMASVLQTLTPHRLHNRMTIPFSYSPHCMKRTLVVASIIGGSGRKYVWGTFFSFAFRHVMASFSKEPVCGRRVDSSRLLQSSVVFASFWVIYANLDKGNTSLSEFHIHGMFRPVVYHSRPTSVFCNHSYVPKT